MGANSNGDLEPVLFSALSSHTHNADVCIASDFRIKKLTPNKNNSYYMLQNICSEANSSSFLATRLFAFESEWDVLVIAQVLIVKCIYTNTSQHVYVITTCRHHIKLCRDCSFTEVPTEKSHKEPGCKNNEICLFTVMHSVTMFSTASSPPWSMCFKLYTMLLLFHHFNGNAVE